MEWLIKRSNVEYPTQESLMNLVDDIQTRLEDSFGLHDLELSRAKECLWPRKSTLKARMAVSIDPQRSRFIVNPYGPHEDNILIWLLISRAIPQTMSFNDLHPVVYIAPQVANKLGDSTLKDLIKVDSDFEDLEAVVEEVSHFVYDQTYYRTHGKIPSIIHSEGMILLHLYQFYKDFLRQEGIEITDGTHPLASKILNHLNYFKLLRKSGSQQFVRNWRGHIELETESWYTQGAILTNGYYEYLSRPNSSSSDTQELQVFYRLSGRDKLNFARDLYSRLSTEGLPQYQKHLDNLGGLKGLNGFK